MNKSKLFTGQPIFNQILSLIPRSTVARLARHYRTDRYAKTFKTYDHLVTMLYSSFHSCSSLREVITGMQASASRLSHLGLSCTPRRSTLSDANERRTADFFQDLYHQIYHRYYGHLPDSLRGKSKDDRVFIIDSTIISLFSSALQSTGSFGLNGKKKGGIKAHVLMQAKNNVPAFIDLTEGRKSDKLFLPLIKLPPGSIIVMDKGYHNYNQYSTWTSQRISWVTRINKASVFKIVSSKKLSEAQQAKGVKADHEIELGNPRTKSKNPIQKARLILFYDSETKSDLEFITNDFKLAAATIADIYKKRWDIEIVFKRIKQNFQLRYFLGDNENAIKIQVWCALLADLLLKVIKDKADKKRSWSMANLSGLVRLHLGTYINLFAFLANPEKALLNYEDHEHKNQLKLFST